MIKIVLQSLKRYLTNTCKYAMANQPEISSKDKQSLLETIASKIKIDLKPPIFISDEEHKIRKLTNQQKLQLGLYLPKSPFNHRLTKSNQKEYLPIITKNLYLQQFDTLPIYFRILQNNLYHENKGITLDYYINLIYKDIYARYLISKGVGVEWNGYCADQGVLNPYNSKQYDLPNKMEENRSILLDFIQNQAKLIQKKKTIGLYSYHQRKFIHLNNVQIQKIKKLGYYIKQEMSEFANFTQQFQVLQQRNSKIYLMIFVENLQKLINPNAVCINIGDRYLILKKMNANQEIQTEYLILSLEVYNQHQKYFKDNKYQKHSTFDSKYLIGMKVMNLPIISQIQGYERPPKSYIVNSNCHLADFQRINVHNIQHGISQINEYGEIFIDGKGTNLFVYDFKVIKKLQQIFPQLGYRFMDLYDTFDDEVYYEQRTKNLLKFRLGEKYYIEIGENNAFNIMEGLKKEGTLISESKITIPKLRPGKKPREKRAFRKQRKNMVNQITEHYSLQQSLQQLNSINISSLSESLYSILIFTRNEELISYNDILNQQQMGDLVKGNLKEQTITRIISEGIHITKIFANQDLIMSLLYLKNIKKTKQILNVIIQPQTETQILIPSVLHLNYLINKAKFTRRSVRQDIKNNINLIKLHPTFTEQNRSLNIKTIIQGVVKSNCQEQYGLGFQALRLWTAKHDHLLGDRTINQKDLNSELHHSEHIRRVFWDLLSLLPQKASNNTSPRLYISKFMLDSIDCYIYHMDECYKNLNIHQAYELTCDFFYNIIHEIYVKSIRKRILTYPNHEENEEHFVVIRRIMELVGVVAPLFPFSAYHISKKQILKWPEIKNQQFHESLLLHNKMIKKRVDIFNKLYLNDLSHATLFCQTLKQPFTQRDLQLFFNIDKVTTKQPQNYNKKCSLKLNKNACFTQDQKIIFFINQDYCIRCDPKSKQTQYLCRNCVDYLQQQVGQPYKYFPIILHTQIDTL